LGFENKSAMLSKFSVDKTNCKNLLSMIWATLKTQKTFTVSLAHYASFAQQV